MPHRCWKSNFFNWQYNHVSGGTRQWIDAAVLSLTAGKSKPVNTIPRNTSLFNAILAETGVFQSAVGKAIYQYPIVGPWSLFAYSTSGKDSLSSPHHGFIVPPIGHKQSGQPPAATGGGAPMLDWRSPRGTSGLHRSPSGGAAPKGGADIPVYYWLIRFGEIDNGRIMASNLFGLFTDAHGHAYTRPDPNLAAYLAWLARYCDYLNWELNYEYGAVDVPAPPKPGPEPLP